MRLRCSDADGLVGVGGLVGGEKGALDSAAFGGGQAGRAAAVVSVDEMAGGVDETVLPAGGNVVEGVGLAVAAEGDGRRVGETVS